MEQSLPPVVPSEPTEVPSVEEKSPEKKRKRTVKRKSKTAETSTSTIAPPPNATQPPTSVLIIDNGGHTLKYGWSISSKPKMMPNITAKLLHQWTVLVGDEIEKVQPNQLESTTRSTERGVITNFANQIQVWKRLLDDVGVIVPTTTEAAQVFGWKVARSAASQGGAATILPQSCAVLLLVPPLCPRTVLEQCMNIWFQEFQFGHVGFAISPVMAAASETASCVVDLGWSATNIVPTYRQAPISPRCIRRVPLGGRHLIQLWKYYVSYRQWNLMDQEFLLEAVQEELGFLSMDFDNDLNLARRIPLGRRPFDREFVLPDYLTTYEGFVRLPPALRQHQAEEAKDEQVPETEGNVQDEPIKEEPEKEERNSDEENEENKDDNDEGTEDEDDDEESDEAKRRRIVRQRQEEERRRQEMEAEHQVLMVSVERFTIPEVLFRPTDAGLAADLAGLPQAIVASISACPRHYQAIMYQSIRLVGGLSQLSNLQERLERELRCLAPCQYEVCVRVVDSPTEQAWLGAKQWIQQKLYNEWSIRIDEWETSRKDLRNPKAWHRLLADNGGAVV